MTTYSEIKGFDEIKPLADQIATMAKIDEKGVAKLSSEQVETLLKEVGIDRKDLQQSVTAVSKLTVAATAAAAAVAEAGYKTNPELPSYGIVLPLVSGLRIDAEVKKDHQIRNVQTGEVTAVNGHATTGVSFTLRGEHGKTFSELRRAIREHHGKLINQ